MTPLEVEDVTLDILQLLQVTPTDTRNEVRENVIAADTILAGTASPSAGVVDNIWGIVQKASTSL